MGPLPDFETYSFFFRFEEMLGKPNGIQQGLEKYRAQRPQIQAPRGFQDLVENLEETEDYVESQKASLRTIKARLRLIFLLMSLFILRCEEACCEIFGGKQWHGGCA